MEPFYVFFGCFFLYNLQKFLLWFLCAAENSIKQTWLDKKTLRWNLSRFTGCRKHLKMSKSNHVVLSDQNKNERFSPSFTWVTAAVWKVTVSLRWLTFMRRTREAVLWFGLWRRSLTYSRHESKPLVSPDAWKMSPAVGCRRSDCCWTDTHSSDTTIQHKCTTNKSISPVGMNHHVTSVRAAGNRRAPRPQLLPASLWIHLVRLGLQNQNQNQNHSIDLWGETGSLQNISFQNRNITL